MLIDDVILQIKAGNGGDGKVSFFRNRGGPNGGNGGNGGNIYFQGSNNINDLHTFRFKKKIIAQDGVAGDKNNLFGKNAPHTTIFVPLGTRITDRDSGRVYEIIDTTTRILLARGGRGGRGNSEFKTATNQAPHHAEKGTHGEEKSVFLELRLIADIGLIGLPNAGKSSLLSLLTNATPKIGSYPFTTLHPNIGMFEQYTIADIPGLIEGASSGRGLGITFLKHIEKTKILLHCIDVTDKDPEKTYRTVREEFQQYNSMLLEKPEIILLTKTDLADERTIKKQIELFQKRGKKVFTCSVYSEDSIDNLKNILKEISDKTNEFR